MRDGKIRRGDELVKGRKEVKRRRREETGMEE